MPDLYYADTSLALTFFHFSIFSNLHFRFLCALDITPVQSTGDISSLYEEN
jgi:hypothetical protein